MRFVVLACVVWAGGAATALAQEPQPILGPQFEQRFVELAAWLRDYHAWEKWFEMWGNRIVHNFDGQPIWERNTRPEPPVWLEAECDSYLGDDGLLANACYIVRNWDEQPLLILKRRQSSVATAAGKTDDRIANSSFLHRVHITGLWMQARYPAPPAYGIVGMQVAVFEVGRLTLPAIGAMVVMISDGTGGHEFKPATTLGFGYRIWDFVPPFMKRPVSLHFNVARTSLYGVANQPFFPVSSTLNLFGLSVSPTHRR